VRSEPLITADPHKQRGEMVGTRRLELLTSTVSIYYPQRYRGPTNITKCSAWLDLPRNVGPGYAPWYPVILGIRAALC
jgi:hypothetical protein